MKFEFIFLKMPIEVKTEENKEKRALEEKEDLTAEQKKRLVELTPGIKTIAELEKHSEEKKEE